MTDAVGAMVAEIGASTETLRLMHWRCRSGRNFWRAARPKSRRHSAVLP